MTTVTASTPDFADKTVWTGNNLEILRGLNSDCVDLIYLDPPFNSNRNYAAPAAADPTGAAFKDTWTLSDLDVAWMGLIADEQPAMYQALQTTGLTYGKGMQSYLCMMAVRLLEMRRVLKDTGPIYLHCDPTASHYLKLLIDSIFGQRNGELFHNRLVPARTDIDAPAPARPHRSCGEVMIGIKEDWRSWRWVKSAFFGGRQTATCAESTQG